jgi:MFS family permease
MRGEACSFGTLTNHQSDRGVRFFRGYAVTTTAVAEYTPPASTAAPYPRPAYAWYVVIVLTFVYIFAFIDRQILNLLVGPIRRDLQISDTEMSLLTGFAFALFYTLFGLPLGRIADAGNRRGLIAAGFAMWSLFTAGSGLARNFTQMLIMRMGVGVGEASLSPAAYSLITDYFPPQRRATAQGIYNMALSVGSGVAFIVGGTVIGLASSQSEWILPVVGSIRSWQLVFFIVGLPGILLALLMFSVAEPTRRGAGAEAKKAPLVEVLAFAKANRATLICHNVGLALLAFSAYGNTAWVPTFFIRHFHWSAALTGQVYGLVVVIAGAFGAVWGGWLSDYLTKRGYRDACMRVALLSSVIWFPAGIAYILVPSPVLSMIILASAVFLVVAPFAVASAALMEIAPARMRGQVAAFYLFVINLIGLGLGPTAVAVLTDYVFHDDNMVGYSLLVVSVTAHLLAALILWAGLRPFVQSKDRLNKISSAQPA